MEKDIIFVTGSMARGGAEGVIANITERLVSRGWHVHILSILSGENGYHLGENVEFIDASRQGRSRVLDVPRMIRAIRRETRRIQPHAVISFMAKVNIAAFFAVKGLGTRLIVSERNDPAVGRNAFYQRLVRRVYAGADMVVFQTTRAKNFFDETVRKKSVVIPNPLKPMPEAADEKTKRIVTVGRLTEQKNHKLLIDAFERVYRDHPDYTVEIYGEGALRSELQAYIDEKNLTAAVHLCGKVDNVPDRIRSAYLFVLPSDYEGLSNALLEALGIGLPCITTSCAGSDDAIRNGENGIIVPLRDCDAMEQAIRELLDQPDTAARMGKAARASMQRYEVGAVADQWEALLNESNREDGKLNYVN